jgi:hypothetical protein
MQPTLKGPERELFHDSIVSVAEAWLCRRPESWPEATPSNSKDLANFFMDHFLMSAHLKECSGCWGTVNTQCAEHVSRSSFSMSFWLGPSSEKKGCSSVVGEELLKMGYVLFAHYSRHHMQ